MNSHELIAAIKTLEISLPELSKETSIPVGTLNKFLAGKKELGLLEFDLVVDWVIKERPQDVIKNALSNLLPEKKNKYNNYLRDIDPTAGDRCATINFVAPDECSYDNGNPQRLLADEAGQMPNDLYDKNKKWANNADKLYISPRRPWILKIEEFCYQNKITPEELIMGYVGPLVKPVPR